MTWHGIIPVVVTPFDANGDVDLDGYSENLDRLVASGIDGVICLATAGEGPSMTGEEAVRVIQVATRTINGRVPVLAGLGGPNERNTLGLLRRAQDEGVDGFMLITPYFYPLTRSEMLGYFRRIASATDLPIMIYNSTYVNMPLTPDAIEELATDVDNFVALKEGNQLQTSEVIRRMHGRISVFTARDIYIHEDLAVGAAGAIAFTANIVPEVVVALYSAAKEVNWPAARRIQDLLNPLVWQLVKRSYPAGLKAAMNLRGWRGGTVRPPLTPYSTDEVASMGEVLRALELSDVLTPVSV